MYIHIYKYIDSHLQLRHIGIVRRHLEFLAKLNQL